MNILEPEIGRQGVTHPISAQKRAIYFLIALLLAYCVDWIGGPLEPLQRTVLAVLAVAVVLWVSEVIPLYITSLITSFLLIVVAGFGPQEIFAPYFDPVIVLFLGEVRGAGEFFFHKGWYSFHRCDDWHHVFLEGVGQCNC